MRSIRFKKRRTSNRILMTERAIISLYRVTNHFFFQFIKTSPSSIKCILSTFLISRGCRTAYFSWTDTICWRRRYQHIWTDAHHKSWASKFQYKSVFVNRHWFSSSRHWGNHYPSYIHLRKQRATRLCSIGGLRFGFWHTYKLIYNALVGRQADRNIV